LSSQNQTTLRCHQFGEVVVGHIAQDLVHRPHPEPWIECGHRAERTGEGAAARGLQDAGDEVAIGEQVIARRWQALHRRRRSVVAAREPPRLGIVQERRPDRFRLADDHGVAEAKRFVGREGGVRSSCHHQLAAPLELGRQAVGLGREAAEEGEGDEVGVGVEVNRLDLLVDDSDLVLRRRDRRQMDARDRRHEIDFVAPLVPLDVDDHDVDPHAAPPFRLYTTKFFVTA
jgi:hypothetical protein